MGNLSTIQTVDVCTIKKVMQLLSVSKSTAGRYISLCRDILQKPKPQIITFQEFKRSFGLESS